jgi:hypothetical protein
MNVEDNAPIANATPKRSLVSAAQWNDISGKRITLDFQKCGIDPLPISSRHPAARPHCIIA